MLLKVLWEGGGEGEGVGAGVVGGWWLGGCGGCGGGWVGIGSGSGRFALLSRLMIGE